MNIKKINVCITQPGQTMDVVALGTTKNIGVEFFLNYMAKFKSRG